jgi:chromate reductase, NAD(P)H dehydrogenase (quinone)
LSYSLTATEGRAILHFNRQTQSPQVTHEHNHRNFRQFAEGLVHYRALARGRGADAQRSAVAGKDHPRNPLYDGDVEASAGIPAPVRDLGAVIAAADGLLLVTPEYNSSIPGPFKNAIDWLSRIEDPPVFTGKPVAVIGASPGGFGTILSQNAWLPVLRTLETRPWFEGRLLVSRAGSVFNADGQLVDDGVKKKLQEFLAGFVASIQSGR